MGLFDKLKRTKESVSKETIDTPALGREAITNELERIYPDQTNPKLYGTLIKWSLA